MLRKSYFSSKFSTQELKADHVHSCNFPLQICISFPVLSMQGTSLELLLSLVFMLLVEDPKPLKGRHLVWK